VDEILDSTVVLIGHCRKIYSADEGSVMSMWQWTGCLSWKGEHPPYKRDRLNGSLSSSWMAGLCPSWHTGYSVVNQEYSSAKFYMFVSMLASLHCIFVTVLSPFMQYIMNCVRHKKKVRCIQECILCLH